MKKYLLGYTKRELSEVMNFYLPHIKPTPIPRHARRVRSDRGANLHAQSHVADVDNFLAVKLMRESPDVTSVSQNTGGRVVEYGVLMSLKLIGTQNLCR